MKKKRAIYAGTFDPLTLGHLDIIERGSEIFDRVLIAVVSEPVKNNTFSIEERLDMVGAVAHGMDNVEVCSFDGLLVEFARRKRYHVLLRGLRAYSDFENEFQMALTNRKLAPEIETLFMMPKESHSYVSSSAVKEVAIHGGDIGGFVPPYVEEALRKRFSAGKSGNKS